MASKKVTYGFDRIINIILAIFLPTNIILGVWNRFKRENWLGVILNIVLFPIFWLIDLITIVLYDDLRVLVD